jgi:hypothetical protein
MRHDGWTLKTCSFEVTMSIGKFRSGLYKLSRALGDANAVKRGTVGKRVGRRITGRATGRALGKLFR